MKIKKIIIATILLLNAFSFNYAQTGQSDFEISKNIDIFLTLYKQIHVNYVDELNSGELMKTAIDALLESLDPYTVYIPESDIEDYKFMTTGQYGGIGALIFKRGNWVYISEVYESFPADKAEIKAGDKIVEINGKSAEGKTVEDVSSALKGQPGTDVTVLFQRDTNDKPFEKIITRQEITVNNVQYYGMVSENIAYINLEGFTKNASKEVKDALIELKEQNDVKGVILDLRGNGGGLLNEAVNIVNIFVEKGQLVVSTKGKLKEKNNVHKTIGMPVDTEIPLVVLVDGGSASASEIVAGAIQDLDRGVIIGQRTFGKGLVQNIIPLTYNAELKVTVAKYYIPSGRCIQELDYQHKDDQGNATKDSLISNFKTKNGRVVHDRGGIEPDIDVTEENYSNISISLIQKYLIYDFATYFYRNNPTIPPPSEFVITDEIFNEFLNFLNDKDYQYKTKSEQALEDFKEIALKENYFDALDKDYELLKTSLISDKQDDLNKNREEIKLLLITYIIPRYYYQKGRVEAVLKDDPNVKKAIDVLNDEILYDDILKGKNVKK